ncbi:MAG: alpha/beta hydrolase [Trueperaceae bacterium]
MPFRIKASLVIFAFLLALVIVLPLIVPIGPPDGVRPLAEVAGDATFVEVRGIDLHVERTEATGAPDTTFVLMHGFASSTYTFHRLAPLLADYGEVVAFDRPGFGLTERVMPEDFEGGFDPYTPTAQVELTVGLMEELGIDRAVLVGHSAGGTVALQTAVAHPERVTGLVLIGAPAYTRGGPGRLTRWLLRTPQLSRIGPLFLRQLAGDPGMRLLNGSWYDPTAIDDETYAAYRLGTTIENWDRALWQISRAPAAPRLEGLLASLDVPAMVIAGAEDEIVPPTESETLARDLPNARLALLPACGHVAQEECPEALWTELEPWLTELASPRP